MQIKISPSMMCADCTKLLETLQTFAENGVDYLHIDIMDGHFVPNFALGTDYCKALKEQTDIPLDIHLMVERPEEKLDWFPIGKGDIVSVHVESTAHLQKALAAIRSRGALPFAALNPATPLSAVEEVLCDVDGLLLMTVNPGFAGQKLIPQTLDKIRRARALLDAAGYPEKQIEADGNVSFTNAAEMVSAGANILVGGTSGIFMSELSPAKGIRKLRDAVKENK